MQYGLGEGMGGGIFVLAKTTDKNLATLAS